MRVLLAVVVAAAVIPCAASSLPAHQCLPLADISQVLQAGVALPASATALRPNSTCAACDLAAVECCVGEGGGLDVCGLNLQGLGLTGPLPDALSALHSIVNLHLGGNNMYTVGARLNLTGLPELEVVDLRGNNFTGPFPKFAPGVQLDYLDLSFNSFDCPFFTELMCDVKRIVFFTFDRCISDEVAVTLYDVDNPVQELTMLVLTNLQVLPDGTGEADVVWSQAPGLALPPLPVRAVMNPLQNAADDELLCFSSLPSCVLEYTNTTDTFTGGHLFRCHVIGFEIQENFILALGVDLSPGDSLAAMDPPCQWPEFEEAGCPLPQPAVFTEPAPPQEPPSMLPTLVTRDTVKVALYPPNGFSGDITAYHVKLFYLTDGDLLSPERQSELINGAQPGLVEAVQVRVDAALVDAAGGQPFVEVLSLPGTFSGGTGDMIIHAVAENTHGASEAALVSVVTPCSSLELALDIVYPLEEAQGYFVGGQPLSKGGFLVPSPTLCAACPRPSGCQGTTACNEGYDGNLCSSCSTGFSASGEVLGVCAQCNPAASAVKVTLGAIVVVFGIRLFRKRQPSAVWGIAQVAFHAAQVFRVVLIAFGNQVESAQTALQVMNSLQLGGIFDLRCFTNSDQVSAFAVKMVIMGAIVPVVSVISMWWAAKKLGEEENDESLASPSRRGSVRRASLASTLNPNLEDLEDLEAPPPRSHTINGRILRVSFTVLMVGLVDTVAVYTASMVCFEGLDEAGLPRGRYLMAEPDIKCGSATQLGLAAFGCTGLSAIAVAMVLLYWKLRGMRSQILKAANQRMFGFMTWQFQVNYFQFAAVAMIRKVLLYAVASSSGSASAVAHACIAVNAVYIFLLVRYRPYVEFLRRIFGRTVDVLHVLDLSLAILTFFSAITIVIPGFTTPALWLSLAGLVAAMAFTGALTFVSFRRRFFVDVSAVGRDLTREIVRVKKMVRHAVVQLRDMPLALEIKLQLDALRFRFCSMATASTSVAPTMVTPAKIPACSPPQQRGSGKKKGKAKVKHLAPVNAKPGRVQQSYAAWSTSSSRSAGPKLAPTASLGASLPDRRWLPATSSSASSPHAAADTGASSEAPSPEPARTPSPKPKALPSPTPKARRKDELQLEAMAHMSVHRGLRVPGIMVSKPSFALQSEAASMGSVFASHASVGFASSHSSATADIELLSQHDVDEVGNTAKKRVAKLLDAVLKAGLELPEDMLTEESFQDFVGSVNGALVKLLTKAAEREDMELLNAASMSISTPSVIHSSVLACAVLESDKLEEKLMKQLSNGLVRPNLEPKRDGSLDGVLDVATKAAAVAKFFTVFLDKSQGKLPAKDARQFAGDSTRVMDKLKCMATTHVWLTSASVGIWRTVRHLARAAGGGHAQVAAFHDSIVALRDADPNHCNTQVQALVESAQAAFAAVSDAVGGVPFGPFLTTTLQGVAHKERLLRSVRRWAVGISAAAVVIVVGVLISVALATGGGAAELVPGCAPLPELFSGGVSTCPAVDSAWVAPGSLYDQLTPYDSAMNSSFAPWAAVILPLTSFVVPLPNFDHQYCGSNVTAFACAMERRTCQAGCTAAPVCRSSCIRLLLGCYGYEEWTEDIVSYTKDNFQPGTAMWAGVLALVPPGVPAVAFTQTVADIMTCSTDSFDSSPDCEDGLLQPQVPASCSIVA